MGLRDYNEYISAILPGVVPYNFADKTGNIQAQVIYMMDRLAQMFEYTGLPDSIPKRDLERMLQCNGNTFWAKVNGSLYVFTGGMGGEPDAYYEPTIYTVANPALKLSENYRIGIDGILVRNDTYMQGVLPMVSRYVTALVENELSMNIVDILSRIFDLIRADNDADKASAEKFLEDIVKGKLGVIGSSAFLEGVTTQPYGDRSAAGLMTGLIEYQQYMKASLYNELGLDANYNMKRESLTMTESQMNTDALRPLLDDMLQNRKEGLDAVNAMFGTNISVDFGSAWKANAREEEIRLESMENAVENTETDPDDAANPADSGGADDGGSAGADGGEVAEDERKENTE